MSVKAFSILHIPPNGVEVTDGEVVSMRNTAGGDPHVGHAAVENGAITGVNLQDATTTFVDDGDTVNIVGTDGHSVRGSVSAAVASSALLLELPAGSTIITDQADAIEIEDVGGSAANGTAVITAGTNQLAYVSLSGNAALAVNGATVKMNNSDGSGLINGTAVVNGGILVSANLSESTKTIVANSFSTGITGYPVDSFATLNVSASGLQNVTVTLPATSVRVDSGQSIGIASAVSNSSRPMSVVNGVLQDINLAPSGALIGSAEVVTVKTNGGTKTAPNSALLLNVTTGVIDQVKLPAGTGLLANGGSIEVENQGATQSVTGTGVMPADVLSVKLPPNAALVGNNVGIQVPVTGTFVDTITPQVNASGVITGFTLS